MFKLIYKTRKAFSTIMLLGLLCLPGSAAMQGNRYVDDSNKCEIAAPGSDWTYDLKRRGKQVVFLKNDGITEVSLEIMPLQGTQKVSRDVAKDQNISYDGWQYVAGRELDWTELHGAENAFSCMYHKVMLQRVSSNTKIIVQEGYFIKNRQAYIVTLVTDSDHWTVVKNELLSIWNSFKIY